MTVDSTAVDTSCGICLENFNSVYRYTEGHQRSSVVHQFCPPCIRQALRTRNECPICRVGLDVTQLMGFDNPHFSKLDLAYFKIKQLFPSREQWKRVGTASLIGGVSFVIALPVYTIINESKSHLEEALGSIYPLILENNADFLTGAKAILLSSTITFLPMVYNEIRGRQLLQQNTINKVFFTVAMTTLLMASFAKMESPHGGWGMMGGAILTAIVVSCLQMFNLIPFSNRLDHPVELRFPNKWLHSFEVIREFNRSCVSIVGACALGKIANYYMKDFGMMTKTVSFVASTALGFKAAPLATSLLSMYLVFFFLHMDWIEI